MTLAGAFSQFKRIEFSRTTIKAALKRSGDKCEGCGELFTDANPPEADHKVEAWEGGDASLENCQMLGKKCCHVKKTSKNTTRRKKADRQSRENGWVKRAAKKSKQKIPSRPMQSRSSFAKPRHMTDPDT